MRKKDKGGKPNAKEGESTEVIRRVQEDIKGRSRDLDSATTFKAMIGSIAQSHSGLRAIRVRRTLIIKLELLLHKLLSMLLWSES